jgi:hypothetical protein
MTHVARRTILRNVALLAGILFMGAAAAQTTSSPTKPILTISGKVTGEVVEFDREKLEALGMVMIETTTPWYKGTVRFEGVPLDKLMHSVGANGERVVALALNDYSTEIPMEDFAKHKAILALKRDGEYMPVRDKGPLFIVYPYDQNQELRSQKYYSRSAWQVSRLIVK